MNINPGELRHKITIEQIKTERDSDGFPIQTYEVVVTTWAKVTNMSGTEIARNGANFNDVKKRFFLRYPSKPIDTDMFIRFGGKLHNITYINNYTEANEYMEIWTDLKELV